MGSYHRANQPHAGGEYYIPEPKSRAGGFRAPKTVRYQKLSVKKWRRENWRRGADWNDWGFSRRVLRRVAPCGV